MKKCEYTSSCEAMSGARQKLMDAGESVKGAANDAATAVSMEATKVNSNLKEKVTRLAADAAAAVSTAATKLSRKAEEFESSLRKNNA